MPNTELMEQLRSELPRLLREHPEVRHELWGMMLEAFPSRQEFTMLLEELRAFREDSNRRFEAMDRRFEELRADMNQRFAAVDRHFEELRTDMNQRFAVVIEELRGYREQLRSQDQRLRDLDLHISSLGGRVGYGLEQMVKDIVEEFANQSFPSAERLVVWDEKGEVFGIAGAEVEFDLYVHNGTDYLVEVKSHLKVTDVLSFYRKVKFAEGKMGRSFIPLVVVLSMDPKAEPRMRELGIRYRIGPSGVAGDSRRL